MALLECRECKGTISSEARVCPHCGIKKPAPASVFVRKLTQFFRKLALAAAVLFAFLLVIGIIVGDKTPKTEVAEQKAKTPSRSVNPQPTTQEKIASASKQRSAPSKSDYIGCKTKERLSELGAAASNNDRQLFASILLSGDCNPIGDKDFSVLDRGVSTSKIRLYINGPASYLDLYVPAELTR